MFLKKKKDKQWLHFGDTERKDGGRKRSVATCKNFLKEATKIV